MANIICRPDWHLPESAVTPEAVYNDRRTFLRAMGFAGASALLSDALQAATAKDNLPLYPGKKSNYQVAGKATPEEWALGYNNFYEFHTQKHLVRHPQIIGKFVTEPWRLKIDGLVDKPWAGDAQDLIADMGKKGFIEERVYRFRCVEAWSMVCPWTGFALSKILDLVVPKKTAKFVRFETFFDPKMAPGFQALRNYPWPYTEGLRIDEAANELAFVATGMYGKPLPKQNGAPLRTVVPWKYGYKSIKSIVRIEFTDKQPKTLWESLSPEEYPFESNVNPAVPHPRWSQATERRLSTDERVATLKYNGYAAQVAALYK
ncbi:MAG: protein-methionine-sulfoxide reductase catalytic subunit MsrP [Pedosphaera sp.]|nr:protein-methionine-sulfoxide reductase catalytic subunit MsrP [Pedosphaera sp.]MSU42857.1 protein-methionine-sulfoxide reductase catalytic subunit MsrP [Pedosphaera sp.]